MANPSNSPSSRESSPATLFANKAIVWWIPLLYLLISDSFYLRTYDSAQVKITLVQMGGVCLLALWICRLLEEGRGAFSKTDMVCLVPFLSYFAYGILSYLHAAYKFSSLDFFLRRIFYMTVALIVIREFNERGVERLTRILIWTTWITVAYGFLQWFDVSFFPPGPGNGPDPFIWRGAFGSRIFSTFGNPNFFADYLVIIFPVLICQYIKTRNTSLLPLAGMLLFDLYYTGTKGAWIGCVISTVLLTFTYAYFFDFDTLKRYWRQVLGAFLVLLMLVAAAMVQKFKQSFTSVSFRLFTWEGTWEMIMTQPFIGTGIGSFWVTYPAFRRPPIFHIEGKHNTETDHAEDEYLEVLFDEGIFGFGIFLWLLLSTFVVAYRALAQLTGGLKKGQRAPPRAYDLLGYLIALQGMMAHNFFDVSLRFVSSGVYLGLLSGLVVNLSRGLALYELHSGREGQPQAQAPQPEGSFWESVSAFFIWPMRGLAWASVAYTAYYLIVGAQDASGQPLSGFNELQGPLYRLSAGGEILQWWIAWGCFLFCVLSQAAIFARLAALARNALVPALIALTFLPLRMTWGFFRADVHHNIAIYFSKKQDWENALKNYFMVGRLNPAFVMSFYFKGNVFNDRFNMDKVYNPNWGDVGEAPRDDFERALAAYGEVRANAPNYVQMHHQMGVLYMKKADWDKQHSHPEEAERSLDQALHWFHMYYNLDPVFPPNYYRMSHIYMMRRQLDKALETYREFIEAPKCRIAPWLLAKPYLRKSILSYQEYAQENGVWTHRHETAEGYTNLGNTYFLANDLPHAETAYKKALSIDPSNPTASRNIQVLYSKAKSEGRLKDLGLALPAGAHSVPALEVVSPLK